MVFNMPWIVYATDLIDTLVFVWGEMISLTRNSEHSRNPHEKVLKTN